MYILINLEAVCFDTDGGAEDTYGDTCADYSINWCPSSQETYNTYDDDDFSADIMCCICGGGSDTRNS